MYDDTDTRREELQSLTCGSDLSEFDRKLSHIRNYYRKTPNELATPMHIDNYLPSEKRGESEQDSKLVQFSGEEGYGRFLDLHELHTVYINLKGMPKLEYLDYLSKFDHLFDIPRNLKSAAYKRYLEQLVEYLEGHHRRAQPLADLSATIREAQTSFEVEWDSNAFPGWSQSAVEAAASLAIANQGEADLSKFSSAKHLETLGLERLKALLLSRGLKCGGTLQQRAERLFAAKDETIADPAAGAEALAKLRSAHKEIAYLEKRVYTMSEVLAKFVSATKENVERKLARTADELVEEEADAEVILEDDDEEEDKPTLYNPKDVPLDFDGKPIPYWLFKLHGLNIRYKCEICSGDSYRGPKAFQRHFQEWKHASGMRALRIPNTSHFHNITTVKDAVALWDRIKTSKEKESFNPSNDEEYEDAHGNVFNKKTYEDLKREGLI